MSELVTHRLTANALWMPEGWKAKGITREQIEKAVLHAIVDQKEEIALADMVGEKHLLLLHNRPLEYPANTYEGMVEINEFTLEQSIHRYVSLEPTWA